jgi:hypothetical protein
MRMMSSTPAWRLLQRTIAAALIAAALQATATGQQPGRGEPTALSVGESVDIEFRNGSRVLGTVVASSPDRVYVEQSTGHTASIRWLDVRAIQDLDTGTAVAIPMRAKITHRYAKALLIGAAIVGSIFFIRITGCFGSCPY